MKDLAKLDTLAEWSTWVPLKEQPAGLPEHTAVLHRLDKDRLHLAPVTYAKLIAHLLQGTQTPFWGGHDLAEIVAKLRGTAEEADINTIVGEAIRLGHTTAGEWLT